jgi:hypothetical protein
VAKVAKKGSPDFVAPSERIAVFDNDGTLWAEQPMYSQAFFIFDRIKTLAPLFFLSGGLLVASVRLVQIRWLAPPGKGGLFCHYWLDGRIWTKQSFHN